MNWLRSGVANPIDFSAVIFISFHHVADVNVSIIYFLPTWILGKLNHLDWPMTSGVEGSLHLCLSATLQFHFLELFLFPL